MGGTEVVVEVVRSGFVEGRHRASVVALGADGTVDWAVGAVDVPVFPRSCNKPLQAVGMLRCGLDLHGELLALAAASHSGESFHLDGVRRILASVGLDESALQTPPDYPLDESARAAWIRSGAGRSRLAMNCSGKHAAMLATCLHNGWPVDDYLTPDGPLQRSLAATFAELTNEQISSVGIDGCGAPLFACSLTALAKAFRALAVADQASLERRLVDAFVEFPEYASGTTRDEATLLRAVPGLFGKAGAEACYAVALPDGRAVALKIDDGGARARPVLMAAALERMGVTADVGVDADAVRRSGTEIVLGGGEPVGQLRVSWPDLSPSV
jgi:L-asparaginase II